MSLVRSLLSASGLRSEWPQSYGLQDYVNWMGQYGMTFPFPTTWQRNEEPIEANFLGLVQGAYRTNGVVFACMMTRFLLFSEARFQFQQMRNGRPGDLFGTPDLSILERPEPGATTGDLLSLALVDADLSGDWFGVRRPGRIKRLRPDWTVIMIGSPNAGVDAPAWDPDAEIIGYGYYPNGLHSSSTDPKYYSRDEVAHFAPIPDPLTRYRGMPLATAAIREIRGDTAATTHKLSLFENAAVGGMIVKFPPAMTKEAALPLKGSSSRNTPEPTPLTGPSTFWAGWRPRRYRPTCSSWSSKPPRAPARRASPQCSAFLRPWLVFPRAWPGRRSTPATSEPLGG